MDQACARCGTFAVVESNGFRELCAPCWVIERHRLEKPSTSFASLVESLGVLVREFWRPALALLLLEAIPHAAVVWFRDSQWLNIGWPLIVGSFVEGLLLSLVVQRTLAGRNGLAEARRHAQKRYLHVVAVNGLTWLMIVPGLLLLCVPGVLVGAMVTCAVPLALFEQLPAHRAIAESFRRIRPLFWEVATISLLIMVLSFLPSLLPGLAAGFAAGRGQPCSPEVVAALRVATVFLSAFAKMPGILFQLVVWGATRPAPEAPGGGSSSQIT